MLPPRKDRLGKYNPTSVCLQNVMYPCYIYLPIYSRPFRGDNTIFRLGVYHVLWPNSSILFQPKDFNCATLMRRHISFAVIRTFWKMRKRPTATICVNVFFFLIPLFSSFFPHLIKKTALGMPVIPFPSEGVFHSATCICRRCACIKSCRIEYSFRWKWCLPSLDISQIRQFKNGL